LRLDGIVRDNSSVFLNSEARVSKSETDTKNLNSNVPNVERTKDMAILGRFEHSSFEIVADFDMRISDPHRRYKIARQVF